ncbi:MAG: hypothetical protein KDA96_10270, partial [Planctomycetaceae bacterium]|nr:hypothetical protein [Planctomycetaceae bacterium]
MRLNRTLLFLVPILLNFPSATAQAATELQWISVPATTADTVDGAAPADSDVPRAAGWYRFVFDTGIDGVASSPLVFVSNARSSVYVNGQRLLHQQQLEHTGDTVHAVGFDVRGLLRQGRNSLAVEVHTESGAATFGVSVNLASENGPRPVTGAWKAAPAIPPVGWNQTDFNDRDWKAEQAAAAQPDPQYAFAEPAEFPAAVARKRERTTPFQFQDGDHVVLLGATFFERAQQFGHLEAALSATLGDRQVTFRNLGWSADTVFAESRGIFDSPEQGYLRMIEHVRAEEPTVILICYGQNEAIGQSLTDDQFRNQYARLIRDLSPTGAVIVLVSPHELFTAARPVPDPSRFNPRLQHYRDLVQQIAAEQSCGFVDMFSDFTEDMKRHAASALPGISTGGDPESRSVVLSAMPLRMSDNGMHLN